MTKKPTFRLLAPAFATALMATIPLCGWAANYSLINLSSNDWSYSEAHGINDVANVVGEFETTNSLYVAAFLYENSALVDIGNLKGPPYAIAYGINHSMAVVGESDTGLVTHAFLYTNGTMVDLGTLGTIISSGYSSAHALNDSGQIVGEASLSNVNVIHGVLWDAGKKTDLGALGGDYSSASAINSAGIIVGESDVVQTGVTNVHGFVYTNATDGMLDLGTLGGTYSSAHGINDASVIVGESETLVGGVSYLRGFVYSNGVMNALGTFGGNSSSASAINSSGMIVGYATDANELSRAFLYDGSTMLDLNTLIPPGSAFTNLATADAINDNGEIAGSGYLADGSYYGYLLKLAPPVTVTITNPAPGATFHAPGTFTMAATTSDSAGSITNVEFLVNGTAFTNFTASPYSATLTNLAAGAYTLTAIADDNTGINATNTVSVSVISPSPFSLTNAVLDASGFSFSFQTQAGFNYEGEYLTAFGATNNWAIFTNVLGDGTLVRVTDTNALTNSQSFYRVIAY